MARLENAIHALVEIFVDYSDGNGKMSKEQMMKLFDTEIGNDEVKAKLRSGDCSKMMGGMQCSGNGGMNIEHFFKIVSSMGKCCYQKKTGQCQEACQ